MILACSHLQPLPRLVCLPADLLLSQSMGVAISGCFANIVAMPMERGACLGPRRLRNHSVNAPSDTNCHEACIAGSRSKSDKCGRYLIRLDMGEDGVADQLTRL